MNEDLRHSNAEQYKSQQVAALKLNTVSDFSLETREDEDEAGVLKNAIIELYMAIKIRSSEEVGEVIINGSISLFKFEFKPP